MIKRFDRLDVATADLADAIATYQRNFGLKTAADGASIPIGDAEIRLRSGPAVADLIKTSGEGLAAIWLEADDLDQAADALRKAGVKFGAVTQEGERRVIAIEPQSANFVPLYLFSKIAR